MNVNLIITLTFIVLILVLLNETIFAPSPEPKIIDSGDDFYPLNKYINQSSDDFAGIYIIHNNNDNKYYVGQSVNVLSRLRNHASGSGNGDIYVDIMQNKKFTVKTLKMRKDISLNEMERIYIKKYNGYTKGYNKTRGNA